jgi:hypothetical protein
MAALRVIAILLLTSLLSGQEVSTPKIGLSNTPKPKLPVVDGMACPGKGETVPNVEISEDCGMYGSWEGNGEPIGRLRKGEEITILEGVNIIREPDIAVIKYVAPDAPSSFKVGDVAFGYGIEADANDVFWAKGVWFAEWDEAVAEKGHCGFTLGFGQGGCTIDIIEYGRREWWVHVKTRSGLTGWVVAAKVNGDKRWFAKFYPLCHYGED